MLHPRVKVKALHNLYSDYIDFPLARVSQVYYVTPPPPPPPWRLQYHMSYTLHSYNYILAEC